LQRAIDTQAFERAASLRDRLRSLRGARTTSPE
jgi:protein-arginine kinase activator protein McsA